VVNANLKQMEDLPFYNYSEGLLDTDGLTRLGEEFDLTTLGEAQDIANLRIAISADL